MSLEEQIENLLKISPNCVTALFIYLIIGDKVWFYNNEEERDVFKYFLKQYNMSYSNATIKKAIKKLKELKFLEPVSKGVYTFNSQYQ